MLNTFPARNDRVAVEANADNSQPPSAGDGAVSRLSNSGALTLGTSHWKCSPRIFRLWGTSTVAQSGARVPEGFVWMACRQRLARGTPHSSEWVISGTLKSCPHYFSQTHHPLHRSMPSMISNWTHALSNCVR